MPFAETAFSDRAAGATPLILVEEISHRVVNEYTQAIAGIRLAAAELASSEARSVLTAVANRLLLYANTHRALQAPASASQMELGAHLERLCGAVTAASLKDHRTCLTLLTETVRLPADRCWRVTLVVYELITNAVRHGLRGNDGCILVELERLGTEIICRVTDTGRPSLIAIPARGSSIVRGLAMDLGGDITWSFGACGTVAELVFPLDAQEKLA